MEFSFDAEAEAFRSEVVAWLDGHLVDKFAAIGDGYDMERHEPERVEWDRLLGREGWIGLSWPSEYGGRGATLSQQLVFSQEYARRRAPSRAFFGESLLGPTLMLFGTEEQKQRFLPRILTDEERWCQGFSEPEAGSDLANVKTRAVLDGDEWVINGQKLWTSQATTADWIFMLVRTAETEPKHRGITFLLVPVHQSGVTIAPIRNITGGQEFNEIFFDDARTSADMVVGGVGNGFKVAMATLGFERGTAFMAAQERFTLEYWRLVDEVRRRGEHDNPVIRQRLADSYIGLELMRLNGYRTISAFLRGQNPGPESSIGKLHWSRWHQKLGELAMDVMGADAMIVGDAYHLDPMQESFLFSRAHTIYAGASEIQRNIIGERVLGLPREPGN